MHTYGNVLKAGGYIINQWRQGRLFPSTGETSYSYEKNKIKLYPYFRPYINSSQPFNIIIEDRKSFCLYIYQYLLYK